MTSSLSIVPPCNGPRPGVITMGEFRNGIRHILELPPPVHPRDQQWPGIQQFRDLIAVARNSPEVTSALRHVHFPAIDPEIDRNQSYMVIGHVLCGLEEALKDGSDCAVDWETL